MALDTNCIRNVGDYYSAHYLDTTFTADVKEPLARWSAQGSAAPSERVKALGSVYYRVKAAAQALPLEARTGGGVRSWSCALLEARVYHELESATVPVEGGEAAVPLLCLF